MKAEFVFPYPVWFILFCLITGFIYAWFLYKKDAGFPDAPLWVRRILPWFRGIAVALLSFLLLAPLLKFVSRQEEAPLVILLQDNSASLAGSQSAGAAYREGLSTLQKELAKRFDFRAYTFSEQLSDSFRLDFKGRETDMAAAIEEMSNLYENRNVGAIIVASDGIFNKGISPIYARNKVKAPVYTIALGDTTVKNDLWISKVSHNQLAYLNNLFPIEVLVQARKLQGKQSKLSIYHEDKLIGSHPIDLNKDAFLQSIPFEINAGKTGIQRYSARLETVQGEATTANNRMDFFIEILDSRQKILILANTPDPDIAAMRMSLGNNPNYEVSAMTSEQFQGNLKAYSLLILHQIPGVGQNSTKLLSDILASEVPVLFIAGSSSNLTQLNQVQQMVLFGVGKSGINESRAVLQKEFSLFTLSEPLQKVLASYEPLQVPYASYKLSPGATVLFRQKIGVVETDYPLFVFQANAERKSALLLGTGIWRWRLHDYADQQNHERFDEFLSKVVQYLCVRGDQRRFRVIASKSYFENEPVQFEAEVYNESYELVNQQDVMLRIFDKENRTYPFTFSRTGKAYTLNAGQFPPGEYRYEANVQIAGKLQTASGRLMIKPVVSEFIQTTADHGLLRTLSGRSGGRMLYPAEIEKLPEMLSNMEDIKPISHSEVKLEDLISLPWIFFLILILLSMEWGLRKWQGSY